MKNVQVIDGARNCVYDVYAVPEALFTLVFPKVGQNVEFIEDLEERIGEEKLIELQTELWAQRVKKPAVRGIHGTLFYGMENRRQYYPTKTEIG